MTEGINLSIPVAGTLLLWVLYVFFFFVRAVWHAELPQPGTAPSPQPLEVRSINHWNTREASTCLNLLTS